MKNYLIERWRQIINSENKSYVIFKNGTCVIFTDNDGKYEQRAVDLMKEYGPVYAGSPAGDFFVNKLGNKSGWVVTSHHNDISTYVSEKEIQEQEDILIGLLGRHKRDLDAKELGVIYIKDVNMKA